MVINIYRMASDFYLVKKTKYFIRSKIYSEIQFIETAIINQRICNGIPSSLDVCIQIKYL